MPLTAFFFSYRFQAALFAFEKIRLAKGMCVLCFLAQNFRKKVTATADAPRFWLMRRSWHQSHLSILHLNFDPQQSKQQAHHHGQRRKSCAIHLCTDVMTDPKNMQYQKRKSYCSSIFMPFVNPPQRKEKKSISAKLNFDASTIQKAITWVLKVSKKALHYLFKVLQYFFRVRYDPRSRLRLFMFFWKIRF